MVWIFVAVMVVVLLMLFWVIGGVVARAVSVVIVVCRCCFCNRGFRFPSLLFDLIKDSVGHVAVVFLVVSCRVEGVGG